jgi:hypothetical protein
MKNDYIDSAEKYLEQAKVELSKSNWWFNRIDKYKAINLMQKAANDFILGHNENKSKDVCTDALKLFILSDELVINEDIYKIINHYLDMCNKQKIIYDYLFYDLINNKVITYLHELKMYKNMLELLQKIAMNHELVENYEELMVYYLKILTYTNLYDSTGIKIRTLRKIAELNIKQNDYGNASENYKECARYASQNYSLKFGVKYYLLYSLILILQLLNDEEIKRKIMECLIICPSFSNSPEYNLFIELNKAYREKNDKFLKKVINNNLENFDNSIIKVLKNINFDN